MEERIIDGPAATGSMPEADPASLAPDAAMDQTIPEIESDGSRVRVPYVRKRPPRRTIEAIDDLAGSDSPAVYTHESDISVGGMVQDGRYRRARAEITHFQKNNRYGQYLEVPKGRRSIFAKQERSRRRRSALGAILVVALLAVIAYLVWQVMSNISFGSLILGE